VVPHYSNIVFQTMFYSKKQYYLIKKDLLTLTMVNVLYKLFFY